MSTYQIGDRVRLTATFTDSVGTAADPSAVSLTIQIDGGTRTSYAYPGTVTKSGTGVYYYDFDVAREGDHDYRWAGTGTVTTASEGQFRVPASPFY